MRALWVLCDSRQSPASQHNSFGSQSAFSMPLSALTKTSVPAIISSSGAPILGLKREWDSAFADFPAAPATVRGEQVVIWPLSILGWEGDSPH